jgi:hypothetical protein
LLNLDQSWWTTLAIERNCKCGLRNAPASKHQPFRHDARSPRQWHWRCSTLRHRKSEDTMRLLLSTMFKKMPVRTTKQRATLCKRCGARIYSLSYLKAHLEAHDRKNH